jgi:hypothetical protein
VSSPALSPKWWAGAAWLTPARRATRAGSARPVRCVRIVARDGGSCRCPRSVVGSVFRCQWGVRSPRARRGRYSRSGLATIRRGCRRRDVRSYAGTCSMQTPRSWRLVLDGARAAGSCTRIPRCFGPLPLIRGWCSLVSPRPSAPLRTSLRPTTARSRVTRPRVSREAVRRPWVGRCGRGRERGPACRARRGRDPCSKGCSGCGCCGWDSICGSPAPRVPVSRASGCSSRRSRCSVVVELLRADDPVVLPHLGRVGRLWAAVVDRRSAAPRMDADRRADGHAARARGWRAHTSGHRRRRGPRHPIDDVDRAGLEWIDGFNRRKLLEPRQDLTQQEHRGYRSGSGPTQTPEPPMNPGAVTEPAALPQGGARYLAVALRS